MRGTSYQHPVSRASIAKISKIIITFLFTCAFLSVAKFASAFDMNPISPIDHESVKKELRDRHYKADYTRYFMDMISIPVHEKLTYFADGCRLDPDNCSVNVDNFNLSTASDIMKMLIEGVEWNDDPRRLLFGNLLSQFQWYNWMMDGRERADLCRNSQRSCIATPNDLLYRSHYSDLQFLHSMASNDGEPAQRTLENIMTWAEYTYKLSTGVVAPETPLEKSKTKVNDFIGRQGWNAWKLFLNEDRSTGTDRDIRRIKLMALGSLLHMIQDSFSDSHTNRVGSCLPDNHDKKAITEFHSYVGQIPGRHKQYDAQPSWIVRNAILSDSNPVKISAQIIKYSFKGTPWNVVESYLKKEVFKLSADVKVSSNGNLAGCGYRR